MTRLDMFRLVSMVISAQTGVLLACNFTNDNQELLIEAKIIPQRLVESVSYEFTSMNGVEFFRTYTTNRNAYGLVEVPEELSCKTKNSVLVGLADSRSYTDSDWIKGMDVGKCAVFLSLGRKELYDIDELVIQNMIHTSNGWIFCGKDSILTSIHNHDRSMNNPFSIACSNLTRRFATTDCRSVPIVLPAVTYNFRIDMTAFDNWPLQCPQLPAPSAITGIKIHSQGRSALHWRAILCCSITARRTAAHSTKNTSR